MTRIHDAFDRLIDEHPPGDPDAILAAAREQATAERTRRRSALGLASAAVVLVAIALAAAVLARGDDTGDRVRSGPGPSVTTSTLGEATAGSVLVSFTTGTQDACRRTRPVERPVDPRTPDGRDAQVDAAVRYLLTGPTEAEIEDGLWSPFAGDGPMLRSVETTDGITFVDFAPEITEQVPNASTACSSAAILSELNNTVGQFDVPTVAFTIDGDINAFRAWLDLSTDLPTTTTTPAGGSPEPAGYAIASTEGVELRTGTDPATDLSLTGRAASAAYAIGTELVVYQGADPDAGDAILPAPDGSIVVWDRNGTTVLPRSAGTARAVLLDAGTVDDSPKALVAEHRGDRPDTAQEALVLIDLETLESETIVENDSWESEHVQARLLPDGDVVGLLTTSQGHWSVVRWGGDGDTEWAVSSESVDEQLPGLAIRGDRAVLVQPDGLSTVRTRTVDLDGGELGPPQETHIALPGMTIRCRDWYDADELSCLRSEGGSGAVGEQGAWRELDTPDEAMVTASR